jgi:hypothetical protein
MATLRVTNLRGRSANVAPNLPDGANITGVVTATSFVGSGANLTGIDATSIKDSGSTVRAQANTSGIVVTGIGTFTGDISAIAGIDVDGHTDLDNVSVAGVSTFDGQVVVGGSASPYATRSVTIQPLSGQTNTYLSVIGGNTTAVAGITFGDDAGQAAGNYAGMVEYLYAGDYLLYKQNNSEKLRIDPAGNVNISGIVTATSYSGDGSALTGIEAGITTTYQYAQNGVITINLGTGEGHEVTLAAGISTITVTGGTAGASHHLIITQPSSGITTVGFSTYFLWPSGSPPNLSRAAASSETDLVTFVVKQQTQTGTGVTQLLASAGIDYQ